MKIVEIVEAVQLRTKNFLFETNEMIVELVNKAENFLN
jgi:hypothetical protein